MDNFYSCLSDSNIKLISNLSKKFEDKDLSELEDNIYKNFDDMKRINIELGRIKKELTDNTGLYYKYYDYLNILYKDVDVAPLAEKVFVPTLKAKIVALDIAIGIPIALYSGIPVLDEELKKEKVYGKK